MKKYFSKKSHGGARLVSAMLLAGGLFVSGCTSVGSLGIIAKSSADPLQTLQHNKKVEVIGPAQGRACRYFLLAVIPWGNSDIQAAVDDALSKSGGDALINVSTATSLYGFVPIYNVFSFTCTTVIGTAVKLD